MKSLFTIFSILTFSFLAQAQQPTVGLLLNDEDAFNGYTLLAPNPTDKVYLLDNCGYVVKEWNFSGWPELATYLLEDGSVMRASGGFIEKRNWDDELIWWYDIEDIWNHHDIEPMPNGNVLFIGAEEHSNTAAIAKGRAPGSLGNGVETDMITEVQPTGMEGGNIVWQWSSWDHTVQDFDPTKEDYGELIDNPGKLDINFSYEFGMGDWLHCNGVDYNADLDQIIFSSRHTSEIYIIDHSTTMAEAASSQGGNSGKGGDFLWRWGNPRLYNAGTEQDRKLFGQHDPKWIPEGYPDEGKITVFNNGDQRPGDWSSIHVIDPDLLVDGNYAMNNNRFAPEDYFWSWDGEVLGDTFFGPIESGVNIQPNGNFLVCEFWGRGFEVTPDGEVVWVYINPVGFEVSEQYDDFDWNDIFRFEKYAPEYAAFDGRELNQLYLIEGSNNNSENCTIFIDTTSTEPVDTVMVSIEGFTNEQINIHPNPTKNSIQIQTALSDFTYQLFALDGRLLMLGNDNIVNLQAIASGMYLLELKDESGQLIAIEKVVKE